MPYPEVTMVEVKEVIRLLRPAAHPRPRFAPAPLTGVQGFNLRQRNKCVPLLLRIGIGEGGKKHRPSPATPPDMRVRT